jgi:homoserine dehydrogenase
VSARIAALRTAQVAPAQLALLGTGTVGSAVWARLAGWQGTPLGQRLSLVHAANSRYALCNPAGIPCDAGELLLQHAPQASSLAAVEDALAGTGTRIVIDATASEAVAAQHAHWLARGIHVVTACKLGQGTSLSRWQAIQAARRAGGTQYGDSATVGAGLPLLRSLRALQAGGDRIHAIAGVLSGSLAWLFNHYDGTQPFSGFVRQARDAGYTEPDPRDDLSGEDVRRKLLILARASGFALEAEAVRVQSLVPPALAALPREALDAALPALDAPLRERYASACKDGAKLRFLARLDADGHATVGLEALPAEHPLVGGDGTDNRVAIWSDRYREQPLVIQGPGAGATVTAAALLDDALAIQAEAAQPEGRPKKSAIGTGCWNT